MTILDNGTPVDERFTSPNSTPANSVNRVFGMPRNITGITIHHWGNKGQKFDNVRNFLCTEAAGTSAHFVVEDKRVACIVSTVDAAWHAGSAEGNATTIGIECRPEMTQGDIDTLVSLIRYLEGLYGSLLIYKHSDWVSTACPGDYSDKIDSIVNLVNGDGVSNCKCAC